MISVIGAGPVGSIAAISCSKFDDVEIYEEHIKQPVKCSGLISKSGLERLKISAEKIAKNRISGARLFSPLGREIEIDGKQTKAYVFDRSEFDSFLLNLAIDSGAKFLNKRIDDISNLKSDRIILATGTNYQLHRKLGLDMPGEFLIGAQYEMRVECDKDFVELHFNVPGFFSWIIPVGDYARVGICARTNPVPYLDKFVHELDEKGRILSRNILNKNFGIIPIHNPKLKTDYGRLITVGDAAGHVKATTGGGVVMGGMAAKFSYEKNYEAKWRSGIGRELYIHLFIRRFLNRLSDKNLDRLFSILSDYKDIIEDRGDMDIASKSVFTLAKNPKFILRFLTEMPRLLTDFI